MADVPDYASLANQQYQQNVDLLNRQTQANRPNVYNPYGSSTWTQDGSGNWTNTQSLTPEQQAIFNQQQGIMGGLMGQFGSNTGMDMKKYSQWADATSPDAAISAIMARMQPQLAASGDALRSRLAAQGLTQGSESYNNAYDTYNREVNDARLGAITQGYATQGSMIDNILKQYQLASSIRDQPLNEMGALQSGNQIQAPNLGGGSAGSVSAPDLSQAASLGYNQQTAANSANTAKMTGMLGGLGGALGTWLGGGQTGGAIGSGIGGFLGGLF